jgi:hypothetical protein
MEDSSCGERSFVSSKGHLGIAKPNVAAGDLIYNPVEADKPFILRKVEGSSYQLVGEAYVFGICDDLLSNSPNWPIP